MHAVINRATSAISDRVQTRIEDWAWRKLALRFTLRSGIRISVACDSEWVVYNDIFVDAEYDDPIYDTLARSDHRTPLQFLDLGANVGFFSLRVAHCMAREAPTTPYSIRLVEGSPSTYRTLRARIGEQRALRGELHLTNGLVGRRTGTARIREAPWHGVSAVDERGARGVTVPYVDLEKLFPDQASPIHLLKCDVEGSEQEFIEQNATLLERVERAVFEFHHERCDVAACLEGLVAAGLTKHRRLSECPENPLGPRSVDYVWR
jgi:FkbM family methyltransferase